MTVHALELVAIARYYEMANTTKRIATALGIRQRGRSPTAVLSDIERAIECKAYPPRTDRYGDTVHYMPVQRLSPGV